MIETILLGMRTIRREMRSVRPMDLSVPQFRVLAFLKHHEGASLSEVAEHIGLVLPSMSKAVDWLVKHGLVTREISPRDRRRVILALTPEGSETFQSARDATQARIAEMLAVLSSEEHDTVMRAMRILRTIFAPGREDAK